MENIVIKSDSKLFKLVSFLSKMPFFSLYIDAYSYIDEHDNYAVSYSTFRDICTFARHTLYSLCIAIFYVVFFIWLLKILVIYPLASLLFGIETFQAAVTLTVYSILFSFYIFTLVLQGTYNKVKTSLSNMNTKPAVYKEPGLIRQVTKLLSQKHNDFCKRVKVENNQVK